MVCVFQETFRTIWALQSWPFPIKIQTDLSPMVHVVTIGIQHTRHESTQQVLLDYPDIVKTRKIGLLQL